MADGVNKAILVGNLGRDPEVSYTQSGTARCRFPLATGDSYTNNAGERVDKTEWHNIVVWGKQAETVGKYLAKGRQVFVEGRIQTRSWDDEKTGQKRYMTEINANRVFFRGSNGQERTPSSPSWRPSMPDVLDEIPFRGPTAKLAE